MAAIALVAAGVAVSAAAILLARRSRRREPVLYDPADPWSALAPRHDGDEHEHRVRLWPIAAFLTGLVLSAVGLVVWQASSAPTPPAAEPYFIEIGSPLPDLALAGQDESPAPAESESPSPTPTAAPSATPRTTPKATPAPKPATPKPTARPPTPTPSPTPPPKPGPSIGANTSCFQSQSRAAAVNYTISARPDTNLSSVTVSLDGRTVQRPPVRGRSSYTGTYTQEVSPGAHTYRIVAVGSDGGVTDRSYPVCR